MNLVDIIKFAVTGKKKKVENIVFDFKDDLWEEDDLDPKILKISFEILIDTCKLVCASHVEYPCIKFSLPGIPINTFFMKLNNEDPSRMKKILDKWDLKPPTTKQEIARFFKDLKPIAFNIKIG